MPTLTQTAGLKIAPLFIQSLVKHYYGKVVKDPSSSRVSLRDEELLYDQVFSVVKQLMQDATTHTVEEFQNFFKSRGVSMPWVNVVRALVPLSLCDLAAALLIKACGGEEVMKRTLGGTKWWQVRDTQGVEAEWVIAEKTRGPYQRKHRRKGATVRVSLSDGSSEEDESEGAYADRRPEMDDAPCLLYIHGGGYYFGTAEGGRGTLERYARKIQGRVFAVNYRLAPQYPFPCAIQDVLAAYLYLIQPPAGASHRAVNPNKIVIGGDSSGGGLALAVLQVIRDSGLPLPAGGVLVSPWCDLTHSFHSITTNTETDILPETGLSMHKPSPLWPPPSTEMTTEVHARLRVFAKNVIHSHDGYENTATSSGISQMRAPMSEDGDRPSAPQFQFYAENRLLRHPLVSPALGYLGGLPPLFFIAGDGEVLRDEIVYTAHRAAHPEKFPVGDDVKGFYPAFEGIENKMRATPVHLQIYDDAAHILPNLFPFATPAKFCVRAISSFISHVIHKPPDIVLSMPPLSPARSTSGSSLARPRSFDSSSDSASDGLSVAETAGTGAKTQERSRLVVSLSQATIRLKGRSAQIFRLGNEDTSVIAPSSRTSSQDDGASSEDHTSQPAVVFAGDDVVYEQWSGDHKPMIRGRVSTQGIIRPLEHSEHLPAFRLPPQLIGTIPEIVLERYMTAKQAADQKFASTIKSIEKARMRNIERASQDFTQRAAALQPSSAGGGGEAWRLAWALDPDEHPPPSSIVGRLDTEEAMRFAQAADKKWLLELTAPAAGGGSGGGKDSWRTAGAAALIAVWFSAKLQRTSVHAKVAVNRAEIVRSVEVF